VGNVGFIEKEERGKDKLRIKDAIFF